MSGQFDPYHRWLGIPAEEQPPHHYRLLGLAPFEADPEVIRDAAERQMAHVRGYALGKHAELSQRILNELGAAKGCLSDPAKKAEYDRRLRRDLAASTPVRRPIIAETSPRPPRIATPPDVGRPPAPAVEAVDAGGPARSDRPAIAPKLLMVVGASAVVFVLVVVLGAIMSRDRGDTAIVDPSPETARPSREAGSDGASSDGAKERVEPSALAHAPLKILPIQNQTVVEGEALTLSVEVPNRDALAGELRYRLDPGAPDGATIDAKTGRFVWTPGEKHGPGVYPITVQVAVVGTGDLRSQTTFHVEVQECNQAPVIHPVQDQVVKPGNALRFFVTASDADQPPNRLTFTLVGAPQWMRIDPSSGMVTCTAAPQQGGMRCEAVVRVSDSGFPRPLFADRTIRVAVAGRPVSTPRLPVAASPALGRPFPAPAPHLPFGATPAPGPPLPAPAPPVRKVYSITLPSGNKLDSSLFNASRESITSEANGLLQECLRAGGSEAAASHYSAGLLHPGGSVMAFFRCRAARRGVGGELDGVLITLYENEHTLDSYGSAAFQPTALRPPGLPFPQAPASLRTGSAWDGAYPRLYATYKDGKKNGWLKSWDEQFRKRYWCQYVRDWRDGLCCFFENDELAMVLECESDQVSAIHSISDGRLVKRYADESEVKQDQKAGPVWERLVQVENEVNRHERSVEERKREQEEELKKRMAGQRNLKNRQNMLDRVKARGEAASDYFGGLWSAGTGRGGVR